MRIWQSRRPLAACRAVLIATLLPDPGTPEKRRELCEKIGGKPELPFGKAENNSLDLNTVVEELNKILGEIDEGLRVK